jgi:hypothetical protein
LGHCASDAVHDGWQSIDFILAECPETASEQSKSGAFVEIQTPVGCCLDCLAIRPGTRFFKPLAGFACCPLE